jgi:DNA polymerase III epsilon subunit family exonuclease
MEIVVAIAVLVIAIIVLRSALGRTPPRQDSPPTVYSKRYEDKKATPSASTTLPNLAALLPRQFIVLDLETTGLSHDRDEIIEFGAIRVTLDSDNHQTFQTLVKPERKIPRMITEITGITQAMVDSEGAQLREALGQFIEFIGDLPLVAFKADFDMGFLYSAARKHGFVINNRYTCALKRARRAWPGLPSYRLVDLAKRGKLSLDEAHRSLGDCRRTVLIFTAATSTIGQKVRWSQSSFEVKTMTKAAKI